ncbi:hypothetical protein PsYK624_077920 [Phanerochaete sordida]|uniref:Uncharacterized protein n=1 Tax=Phanerochaete sordida TaxID=48140 RepID=A0A9P3G9B6_9APHY|nr:hypothetical protein PsYK624_077920 [Phanerochaete sordida]
MLSLRYLRLQRLARTPVPLCVKRFYNPDQKGDPHDQAHQSGLAARDSAKAAPLDAANPEPGKKAPHDHKGNPEGLGFAEQVGSQGATATNAHLYGKTMRNPESDEGAGAREDITPPAFGDAVKKKLGFETTAAEAKQNRGGGVGVTGTGQVTLDRGT